MSRQLEQELEARAATRRVHLAHAVDFGLQEAVESDGRTYEGFGFKHRPTDSLMVLKARTEAGAVVAFVGAGTLGDAILKATRMAVRGELAWKVDSWGG